MPEEEIDLLHYLNVIKKRKSLMIQIVIVITLIVLFSSFILRSYSGQYESRVELLLSTSGGSSVPSFIASLFSKGSVDLETQMQIIKSPIIAEIAANKLNMDLSSVSGRIETEVVPNSAIIVIKARDKNPTTAKKIADATAKAYLYWTNIQNIKSIQDQQKAIGKIISQTENKIMFLMKSSANSKSIRQILDNPAIVTTLYGNLVQRYTDLEISALTSNASIKILNPADTPRNQVGPSIMQSTLTGLVFGLIVALVFAFVLEYIDSQHKSFQEKQPPIS